MSLLDEVTGQEEAKPVVTLLDEVTTMAESSAPQIGESIGERVTGGAEAAATLLSGSVAPIVGGLAGAAALADPTAGPLKSTQRGAGAADVASTVTDALTYEPRTETGKAILNEFSELMRPVGEFVQRLEQKSGDMSFELGDDPENRNPVLGAIGTTLPGAAAMAVPGVTPLLRRSAKVTKEPAKVDPEISSLPDPIRGIAADLAPNFPAITGSDALQIPDVMREALRDEIIRRGVDPIAVTDDVVSEVASQMRNLAPKPPTQKEVNVLGDAFRKDNPEAVAQSVEPDLDVVQAGERLGLELEPGTVSTNPSFIELTQKLKSSPNSKLKISEINNIAALGERADKLVNDLAPGTSRASFNSEVKQQIDTEILDLKRKEQIVWGSMDIPESATVRMDASDAYIRDVLRKLQGNESGLRGPEKALLGLLKSRGMGVRPKQEVSYELLNRIRQDVGEGFEGRGVYRDVNTGILDEVYAVLAKDQKSAAAKEGFEDDLIFANALTEKRKGLEKLTLELFGQKLQKSIVQDVLSTKAGLAKGNDAGYDRLMKLLPDNRRQEGAALILDALMGDNAGRFSVGNFASAFFQLNKNPGLKAKIMRDLPPNVVQTFNDLGTVATAISKTRSRQNTSGTADALLARIESESGWKKLLSAGETAAAEGAASAAGAPGAGLMFRRALKRKGTGPDGEQVAVDLLTSRRFRAALNEVAKDEVQRANRIIQGAPEYKSWVAQNPAASAEIAELGFFGWLAGQDNPTSN